jgi:putative copper resistance protein D
MVDPLIASRAIHFASSLVVGGVALFSSLILQSADAASLAKRRQQQVMLAALVLAVLSAATWLIFLASRIAQSSVAAVIVDGTAWSVLTETQFGHVWMGRFLVATVLFCVGLAGHGVGRGLASLQAALSVVFVGTLAWSGHGAGSMGYRGFVHLAGDASHLIAASAWVGGLMPLLIFIGPRAFSHQPPLLDCFKALRRFSTLAGWSVAVLAASGVLNTWFMTSGLHSFFATEYGDLVLVKIALFIVMLGFGAVNRYWLTPRLLSTNVPGEENTGPLRLLCASVSFEITLGLIVVCVVAVLGQLPPPGHMHQVG